MADFLVKTLIECGQAVPDFFQDRIPEDVAKIDFNDDSGAEDEDEAIGETNGGDDVWGAGDDNVVAVAPTPAADIPWTGGAADSGGTW